MRRWTAHGVVGHSLGEDIAWSMRHPGRLLERMLMLLLSCLLLLMFALSELIQLVLLLHQLGVVHFDGAILVLLVLSDVEEFELSLKDVWLLLRGAGYRRSLVDVSRGASADVREGRGHMTGLRMVRRRFMERWLLTGSPDNRTTSHGRHKTLLLLGRLLILVHLPLGRLVMILHHLALHHFRHLLLGTRIHVSAVRSVLLLELIHLLPSAALVHRRLVRLHAWVLLLELLVGGVVVLLLLELLL
jgi:hypothetical protein